MTVEGPVRPIGSSPLGRFPASSAPTARRQQLGSGVQVPPAGLYGAFEVIENMSETEDGDRVATAVYRTECDCGWTYENRAYGKVEEEAMAHVDHAGFDHHASEPERVVRA